MSIEFTKENLNTYLSALAKEFRKLNGTAMPAEIILIGGASILANYGFRDVTYDVDAIILASSTMKDAINRVGDNLGLPNGWLNADFKATKSYSDKLFEVSTYYKTFSNIVTIRTISAEYLIAMKLMSGRQYKNDLSDVVGILSEHQKCGNPISLEAIHQAITVLYGKQAKIPQNSHDFLQDLFRNKNFHAVYTKIRENEQDAKEILLNFERNYPKTLKEENIDSIIQAARGKREEGKPTMLSKLEMYKEMAKTQEKRPSKKQKTIGHERD